MIYCTLWAMMHLFSNKYINLFYGNKAIFSYHFEQPVRVFCFFVCFFVLFWVGLNLALGCQPVTLQLHPAGARSRCRINGPIIYSPSFSLWLRKTDGHLLLRTYSGFTTTLHNGAQQGSIFYPENFSQKHQHVLLGVRSQWDSFRLICVHF